MKTSVAWLNTYLDPPASADEQAELLTRAGFPLEEREDVTLPDGTADVMQDYEMTSNRGDAVCHLGLAREIAAISGRTLVPPPVNLPKPVGRAEDHAAITNHEPTRCPLYTGRIIRGVKVGPSPRWLANHLIARGDIPRNNVVDATNYVLFEMGQPTHVFDLAKLKGAQINIRMARPDEPFLPIGEGAAEVKLGPQDLVIADAQDAVAIGGVKGGALSAVTDATTDLLLEAATFDPVAVRNTSRRLNIASDSSYRFERGVHPLQINAAADRLAALIIELAGGERCDGVLAAGAPVPERRTASMRPARCRRILGVEISDDQMAAFLDLLGFEPQRKADWIHCTVPANRLDIEREIDLIEEVGRMYGHDRIPIADTIDIRVAPPQPTELARKAVADELVGMDFIETVTHSLVSEAHAKLFQPPGLDLLRVDDERAKAEPVLQTSILPGLLRVYALNRDNGVPDVRLFEHASTFALREHESVEGFRLGMIVPQVDDTPALRVLRGIIDRTIEMVAGDHVAVTMHTDHALPWFEPCAELRIDDTSVGSYGLLTPSVRRAFDIDAPVAGAELNLLPWYETYPPIEQARRLPSFPGIERDISIIVPETVCWAEVESRVLMVQPDDLQAVAFITTYRGKQVPAGHKSLTLRLVFRAADRTLTHEEIDPRAEAVMEALQAAFGAEIRT
jgi:phenylalanyl-tRNA synthetase beta chain